MDSDNELQEKFSEETDLKSSIEDFLRELEEKEKDLNISQEMVIEIEEDASEEELPEFIKNEISAADSAGEISNIQISSGQIQPAQEQSDQVAVLENQVGELKKALQNRQKDFDNYRKRTERERGDTFQNQIGNLATQMLPVLDNLNRALDAASHFDGEQSKDFRQFFDGIVLVNQQLNEILSEMGVHPVMTVGEAFNPYLHDAVATEPTNDFPPNTITEELLRGYRIGDKLIRAAMVKVAAPAE